MFVERQVSGVNLPFNLLQDPCVEGVGNGENRPFSDLHAGPAKGDYAAEAGVNAAHNWQPKVKDEV